MLDVVPWLFSGAVAFCAFGFLLGFLAVPLQAWQGDVHRIVYIHLPATWMALLIYLLVALAAGIGEFLGVRAAAMWTEALVPTGAVFAFVALWTGSLWGKPIWGSWWVWDARWVADLALLLLYIGLVVGRALAGEPGRADRAVAWIALPGTAVVLATLVSVALLPTTPTGPADTLVAASAKDVLAVAALVAVAVGVFLYSCAMVLIRLRCVILERAQDTDRATAP
ncbi:MAG: cytochrome c biogenesis protein CcsA [Rubrivivax sp.]|nr:cytochrome c biogenesis protein CcsA [Rubrivivax sp.]